MSQFSGKYSNVKRREKSRRSTFLCLGTNFVLRMIFQAGGIPKNLTTAQITFPCIVADVGELVPFARRYFEEGFVTILATVLLDLFMHLLDMPTGFIGLRKCFATMFTIVLVGHHSDLLIDRFKGPSTFLSFQKCLPLGRTFQRLNLLLVSLSNNDCSAWGWFGNSHGHDLDELDTFRRRHPGRIVVIALSYTRQSLPRTIRVITTDSFGCCMNLGLKWCCNWSWLYGDKWGWC